MKIALFHNLPSGGAKRAVFEWVKGLSKSNQLDEFTLSSSNLQFCDIEPFIQRRFVYQFNPRKFFSSPFGRINQFQRWRDLNTLIRINKQIALDINLNKYDVIFAQPCQFTYIPALLQGINIPSVYFLHEPFGKSFTRTYDRPYLQKNTVRDTLDRFDPLIKIHRNRLANIRERSIKSTHHFLSNSAFTNKHFKLSYARESLVCHYGVDFEVFKPINRKQDCEYVLSVGELTPRKGFDFIIEALSKIHPDRRPHLKIACNMENINEREFIVNKATSLEVELTIKLNLNTDELVMEYNNALLCVYAPYSEPFGLVPLESMACGTPVIGVAEGGLTESILDGVSGYLVERDSKKFAHAVSNLLCDKQLRESIGEKARNYVVAKWGWDRSVNELEEFLQRATISKNHGIN